MKLGRTCPKRLTIVFQSSIFWWRSVSSRERNCWILDINNCWWTWYPLLLQKWTEILWPAMRRWIRKGFLGGEEGRGGLLSRCWGEKWHSCNEGINIQQSRIQFLSKKSNYQSWEQTSTKQTNQGGGLPKGIQGLSQVYEIWFGQVTLISSLSFHHQFSPSTGSQPTSESLQRKLHVYKTSDLQVDMSQPTPKKTHEKHQHLQLGWRFSPLFFLTFFFFSALKGKHDLDQHFFQELKAVYLGPFWSWRMYVSRLPRNIHDTLHLSIYEKSICHPSTKNSRGCILETETCHAFVPWMIRTWPVRMSCDDCVRMSGGSPVGLVSCPLFFGVGVFKGSPTLLCLKIFSAGHRQKNDVLQLLEGWQEGLGKNHHKNDRSLWRVWSIPSYTEGIWFLVNESCSIYFPGVLETWRLINLKIRIFIQFVWGEGFFPDLEDLVKFHDQETSNQNLNLTNSRGMLPDPPKKTC